MPVGYAIDGLPIPSGRNGYAALDTRSVVDGSHLLTARLTFATNVSLDIVRSLQVRQTPVIIDPVVISGTSGSILLILGPGSRSASAASRRPSTALRSAR